MTCNHRSLWSTGALLVLSTAAHAQSAPTGGVIAAGQANIAQNAATTTITQTSANVVINWQTFNIGANNTVQFIQPGASSIALNRVLGADPSVILGTLQSNGRVFLLNPNGILFGTGASVNVGGLVASTMKLSDSDFLAGRYAFSDAGTGTVVNQGTITAADGGFVALMGRTVSNQGVISARLGTVALAGAEAVTLDLAGDGLLNVSVSTGAVNALVENGGMIRADGGHVLLTAQAAGNLLNTVVNNTGVIQAQTISNQNGSILLLGDMQGGTVNVGGTLDASAPNGGNGGFIETSAATVNVRGGALVSTLAPAGITGNWLIDPHNYTIGSSAGANMAGTTLSALLVTNNITISTAGAGTEPGDIFVNDAVTWTASGAPTTLTLLANGDVNINAPITATNGNLNVCCGRDVNVNAAITATNGSVLLSANRDVNQRGAITVTDGNLMMCAANDVNIFSAITVTRGTNDPTRSLGLPRGLTLSADTDGSGPGIAGGTVTFDSLAPKATVTAAPVTIYYNPVSYTAPTDYTTRFTLTEGAALRSLMLVFADGGSRAYDGTTATTLSGLIGDPAGVSLVAGPGAVANYVSPDVGVAQTITYTGYTLQGSNAGAYALAFNCCGPVVAHTTGTITASTTVPPPPPPPPPPTPTPTPTPIDYYSPPVSGETILGITPVAWVPTPGGALVEVTEESLPANMLSITPVEEVPPEYVAPVQAPKQYRN
ncbi:hypothetical protein BH11PSE14_BH11PSE14_22300 [soil metagenome]